MNAPETTALVEPEVALEIRNISKRFGRQQALDDVSIRVATGRVTALLGQNGCGKSTLIKILAGVYSPDRGTISVRGNLLDLPANADEIRQLGVHFVHQDLGLVKDMTIAENMALTDGFQSSRAGRIRWRKLNARTAELMERVGLEMAPTTRVRELSPAQQALLAIARAFAHETARASSDEESFGGPITLILDEPTASLPPEQVEVLFRSVRQARNDGAAIVFVTHRLDEVVELADDVVVLRDGHVVLRSDRVAMQRDDLVEAIVGTRLGTAERRDPPPAPGEEVVLGVRGLTGRRVRDVALTVRRGEIVGLAGLQGSGRSEIARLVAGAQRAEGGEIAINNNVLGTYGPRESIRSKVAFVPEDRRNLGAIPGMTLRQNLSLPAIGRYWKYGRLHHRAEERDATDWLTRFAVNPPASELQLGKLSGGNQQKTILAKWFRLDPDVLVLDEPTQGIDVGAKAEILEILRQAAADGKGIVLISSEFSELEAVCHRIVVLSEGRVVDELDGDRCRADAVARACYGRKGTHDVVAT